MGEEEIFDSTPSKCNDCRNIYGSKDFECLFNYSNDIDKIFKSYPQEIKELARKHEIDAGADTGKIKNELLRKGRGDEVSDLVTKYAQNLEPIMNKLREAGIDLKYSDPFSDSEPIIILNCPNFRSDEGKNFFPDGEESPI